MGRTDGSRVDVVVVGGGLGGLSAAALLARDGLSVRVLERAGDLGGRGATTREGGFHLNLGGHALYRKGPGAEVLGRLGVPMKGKTPSLRGQSVLWRGDRFDMPVTPGGLLGAGLLSVAERMAMARVLASVMMASIEGLDDQSLGEWLSKFELSPALAGVIEGLFRVSTYARDPSALPASAAIRQLRMAIAGNVLYLDEGWQSLVEGLADAATKSGARIETRARVSALEAVSGGHRVSLASGGQIEASHVVLAVPPGVAAKLSPSVIGPLVAGLVPCKAACLDVALSALPEESLPFVLGLDEPIYVSVHSLTAKLAPEGGALIHAMRYLGPDEDSEAVGAIARLEALMDRFIPGWRDHVVHRRALPKMTVAHGLPRPGGSRPESAVPGLPGVFLVGDWVGNGAMLADASFETARVAAEAILKGREAMVA